MPTDIEIDLFLKKLLKACSSEDGVVVESYAVRRADAEMGWGIPEIKGFLPSLERADFVRCEPRKYGAGVMWMFLPFHEDFGDLWIELVPLNNVIVVSFHISDGEGEP